MRRPVAVVVVLAALSVVAVLWVVGMRPDRLRADHRRGSAMMRKASVTRMLVMIRTAATSIFSDVRGDGNDQHDLDSAHLGYLSDAEVTALMGTQPPDPDPLQPPSSLPPPIDLRTYAPPTEGGDVNGDRPPREITP